MQTLTLSTGSFDQVNTFNVGYMKRAQGFVIRASLHKGYNQENDGIYWAMQSGGCIKAQYTEADEAENVRLANTPVLHTGDTVLIDGVPYTIKVNGDFSDCAVFAPV